MGNANANLGRPPRPPGFKKRPNTAGAQLCGNQPVRLSRFTIELTRSPSNRRRYGDNIVSMGAPEFDFHTGAQPMGGLPIEEFLAVMNGGGDSGDLVGKLMQLGISLASNAG